MKPDRNQRKSPQYGTSRGPSSAAAILKSKGSARITEDYTSFGWLMLILTFITITLISFLFTPFTHQLDEIKNVLLMLCPPLLLLATLYKMDFSAFTWKRGGALILLGLYFVSMVVSWLVNPYKLTGESVIWFNLGVATFTVVFAWFMNTENKLRKTMQFFVWLTLASTLLGLFLYAGRYMEGFYEKYKNMQPWGTLFYTLFSSHGDMYSFILNSDFYAAFLVMMIPLILSMFFVEQRTGTKILALSTFLLANLCLFLTNSNDSFIAMGIAYILYFIIGYRYVKEWGLSRRFVLACVIWGVIALAFTLVMMWPKLNATYDFKSEAFEGRRVLWGGGYWPWIYGDHLDGKSPDLISIIFGTGPGGYRHYFPWFRRPDFFDQQINNVTSFGHNFYLDTLLEQGLIGLVLLIGFIVRVFADGLRQIRTTQHRTHLFYQLAILVGLVGISIQNFSSPNNRWAVAGMIYWTMFGLSIGLAALENPPVSGDNNASRIGGIPVSKISWWAAMALAIVFVLRCVFPGMQFIDYWRGAALNASGLRAMESVYPGMDPAMRKQLLTESRANFEAAITANPTFATSYYKLGHVYNQLDDMQKAIDTYEDLDKVWANYSEVQLNLGIMYAQKAATLTQNIRTNQAKAQELLQQMQTTTGSRRKALEDEYNQLQEQIASAVKSLPQNREKLMETSYQHMKEAAHQSLKPNTQYLTGTIGRELVSIYEEQGQQEKADQLREEIKQYFQSLIDYSPKLPELQADQKEFYPKAQSQLLALAQETKNDQEAITVLKRMVKDNPDNPLMLQALLETYDHAKQPKEKLDYLEKAVHADPTDADLRLSLAQAYKAAGQPDKYLAELRRVEVLRPDDKDLLRNIYTAYQQTSNTAALKAYEDKLTSAGISPADILTTPTTQSTTQTILTQPTKKEDEPSSK